MYCVAQNPIVMLWHWTVEDPRLREVFQNFQRGKRASNLKLHSSCSSLLSNNGNKNPLVHSKDCFPCHFARETICHGWLLTLQCLLLSFHPAMHPPPLFRSSPSNQTHIGSVQPWKLRCALRRISRKLSRDCWNSPEFASYSVERKTPG
jgi:hypothetical protein